MAGTTSLRGLVCALVVGLLSIPIASLGDEPETPTPESVSRAAAIKAFKRNPARVTAASAKSERASDDGDKPAAKAKGKPKLTPSQTRFIKNELASAAAAGDPLHILSLLSPQLGKLSPAHVEAMNELLAEQDLPSIGSLAASARLELFRARVEKGAPELSLQETVLILADVRRQIDDLLGNVRKAKFMNDPLPKPETLLEYRDVLFDVHVQKNELINTKELVEFARSIQLALDPDKEQAATEAQKEILATSFRTIAGEVTALGRDMEERALEMRLDRLDLAVETLETDLGLKEKFFAAYAIAIDGELLLAGFKEEGSFSREALNEPELVDELAKKIEKGKMLAGELIEKSQALFVGLHWWRRGRYGRGPEGYGLLKSAAAATDFAASIPLFMPRTSPAPTNPVKTPQLANQQQGNKVGKQQSGQQSPDYDRRHHYAWAWQDRQFQMSFGSQTSHSTKDLGNKSTGTSFLW